MLPLWQVNNSERYAKSCWTQGHILHTLCESDAPDECTLQSVEDNPCGFCGLDGCLTQQLEKKGGGIIITSNCKYHYAQMQYKAAAKFSKSSPCTNVPIHCPICPSSVSKAPQTIWKYNALFHLTSEHATDSTPPKIPRQLLADMHITREEEKALKITEEATDAWREEHDIPCTESLLEMIQAEEIQKRERSDTVSTAFSDSHDPKRPQIYSIPE